MAESEPNTRIAKFYLRNKDTGVVINRFDTYRCISHYPGGYSPYLGYGVHGTPLEEVPLHRRFVFTHKDRKTREDLTPKTKDGVEVKDKEITKRNGDLKLRFAHHTLAGKDDPVADGRDLAFAGDVLPSDRKWEVRSRGNVAIGTTEEKELADLARRGVLKGGSEEGGITLESVKGDGAEYTVRIVRRKRKGGKGRNLKGEGEVVSGGEDAGEVSPAEGEVATIWEEFLAEMEAEGWVPVAEDDLASVAESWVVMQEEEEEGGEKT